MCRRKKAIVMWLMFAFGSALFAGLTGILAKCGIKNTDSNVATALRTIVVLIFSWIMVFLVGSQNTIGDITLRTLVFLILSGLATGASWLCYFHALQIGDINKVTPVDKSSTVLTMLLAFIFLHEELNVIKVISMVLIAAGTLLMIQKKENTGAQEEKGKNPGSMHGFCMHLAVLFLPASLPFLEKLEFRAWNPILEQQFVLL